MKTGDGEIGEGVDGFNEVSILNSLLLPQTSDPIRAVVEATYPFLLDNLANNSYFNNRAILAPTLDMVNEINQYMCALLPGEQMEFTSNDSLYKSSDDSEV